MNISNSSNFILEIRELTVTREAEVPLSGLNLKVREGEIHAILGDNYSGKSTLVNVISGIIPKTSGEIIFDNQILNRHNPSKARALGIETIYQNLKIFPFETLYENLFINKWLKKNCLCIDRNAMRERAYQVLRSFFSDQIIDLKSLLINCNDNVQNIVDIAKSFCFFSKLLIVDEISHRLDPSQLEKFQYILSVQRQKGTAIIYLSNNIDEIYNFANYASIMKNGKIVETYNVSNYDKVQLVHLTYSQLYNRKELERSNFELFYLKNFNESIINNIPLSLLVTDTRGNVILANRRFLNMFKVDLEQFQNRHFNEMLKISDEHLTLINKAIVSGKVERIYSLDTALLDSTKKIVIYLIPFYGQDNAFQGTIFIFNILFEGFNLEAQVKSYEKMGLFKDSLAGIAHEIRNPLGIITNFIKIIKSADSLSQVRESADRIEKEINRLKDVTNDLLTRAHSAKQSEQGQFVEIKNLLNEIRSSIIPAIKEKGIELTLNLHGDVKLAIEPELFKQVVMNIIINSIEAMPSGGHISVDDADKTLDSKRYYVINFTDSGIGINKEDILFIFEPFYTSKQSDEIRGLGLSICKDVITQYKGFITVDSSLNKGSTFHVFFPCEMLESKKD